MSHTKRTEMANRIPEFKIVVLGSGGVGKSALTIRLVTNNFLEEYDPTIEDSYRKQVCIDDTPVLLDILDTAGQEEFSSMQDQWMREGQAFLLVYAINSKASFDEIDMMRQKILRTKEDEENVPIVIVGNKSDLSDQRQVHRNELDSYSKMVNAACFETSAKDKICVEDGFYQCYREWRAINNANTETEKRKKKKKKRKRKKAKKNNNLEQHIDYNLDEQKTAQLNKMDQKHELLIMPINIAVIGMHNVGKHKMIHNFMGEFGNDNSKKDVYSTMIETKETNCGDMNDHVLGYKKQLELILSVYCIEDCSSSETYASRMNHLNLVPSGSVHLSDFSADNGSQWDLMDVFKKNDAFLFVAEVIDKQSLLKCIELISYVDDNMKPIIIVIRKWDLPLNLHELTEIEIAEFVNDAGVPFIRMTMDSFKEPFHRLIAAIRGYTTPDSFMKIENIYQHSNAAWSLAQSLNGKYLYSTGNDGTIRIWDIETVICVAIILYHTGKVYKVEEYVNMHYLITCGEDGLCCVWNDFYTFVNVEMVEKNNIPLFMNCPRFIFQHNARIRSFCVCDNNMLMLCTISDDKYMKLWSLIDGQLLFNYDLRSVLNQVIYVKEYDKLFISSADKFIYMFEVNESKTNESLLTTLEGGHNNNINEMRICKKNENEIYIISMDESGYIRCWNANEPSSQYFDFQKHEDSINYACICKVNESVNYDYILCTASRDKTMRGYSIPSGEIVYNIADTQDTLRAIDCNWNENYIVSAGKDNYIRCYKLMSNKIGYTFRRYDINNNLKISLKWAYQRHEGYLNRILCAKQHFNNIVFSADRNGIILGWDMKSGKCIKCFGDNNSETTMITDPKKEVRMEFITMIIQFMQLSTFAFSVDINWGQFNDKYNPFLLSANLFQFDISKYSSDMSWINWFYNNISVPFEWIISVLCVVIFTVLFSVSYKFKYMTDKTVNRFKSILSFFCWITMGVGFVPILRNIFKIFTCNNMKPYLMNGENDCWTSVTHWIYICISIMVLIVYLPTAYRIEARSGDLEQINAYYWIKWSKDYPEQRRVHFASLRTNSLAAIDKSIVIIMIAVSVFLVYGENVNEDVELSAYEEKELLKMDYIIIGILLAASAILCIAILIKPPFYFRNMNIFNASLFFGVLWTDLWALFVINEHRVGIYIRQYSRLRQRKIDKIKTIGHLCVLIPFMLFGALLMYIRTYYHWYDEIRGGFRKMFYNKGIGIISENNDNVNNGKSMMNATFGTKKNQYTICQVNEEEKEEELPNYEKATHDRLYYVEKSRLLQNGH
eukprot:112152_1